MNEGTRAFTPPGGDFSWLSDGVVSKSYCVDSANKKKYAPIRDNAGAVLASRVPVPFEVAEGQRRRLWAKFPAPAATVATIDFYPIGTPPIEGVPIGAPAAAAVGPAKTPAPGQTPRASAPRPDAEAAVPLPATVETDAPDVRVTLRSVTREPSGMVKIVWAYQNAGTVSYPADLLGRTRMASDAYYVDFRNVKKYEVVRDGSARPLAAPAINNVEVRPGATVELWAMYPAPPAGVEAVSIYLPGTQPIEPVHIR